MPLPVIHIDFLSAYVFYLFACFCAVLSFSWLRYSFIFALTRRCCRFDEGLLYCLTFDRLKASL